MKNLLIVAMLLAISGCASISGWQPVVDYRTDQHPERLAQDQLECKQLANQAAGTVTETLEGVGVGALVGAAGGAAIGAIVGNPATGAALGSTVGLAGGLYEGSQANSNFKHAYSNCLRNRGHFPIN